MNALPSITASPFLIIIFITKIQSLMKIDFLETSGRYVEGGREHYIAIDYANRKQHIRKFDKILINNFVIQLVSRICE